MAMEPSADLLLRWNPGQTDWGHNGTCGNSINTREPSGVRARRWCTLHLVRTCALHSRSVSIRRGRCMLHARLRRVEAAPAARKFLLFSTSMVNKPPQAPTLYEHGLMELFSWSRAQELTSGRRRRTVLMGYVCTHRLSPSFGGRA